MHKQRWPEDAVYYNDPDVQPLKNSIILKDDEIYSTEKKMTGNMTAAWFSFAGAAIVTMATAINLSLAIVGWKFGATYSLDMFYALSVIVPVVGIIFLARLGVTCMRDMVGFMIQLPVLESEMSVLQKSLERLRSKQARVES